MARPIRRQPPKYPGLTQEELRALYQACPTPQMARALWEVYRLREIALEAGHFVALVDARHVSIPDRPGKVLASLRDLLQGEPVVREVAEAEQRRAAIVAEMQRKMRWDLQD